MNNNILWIRGTLEEIKKYFPGIEGELLLEIYYKAVELFPNVLQLQPQNIRIDFSDSGHFEGTASTNPEVANLALGNGTVMISKNIFKRLHLRLGFETLQKDIEEVKPFIRLFALAHEVGHIIQGEENKESENVFIESFKDNIERTLSHRIKNLTNYTDEEYNRYVQSDIETNADFIALYILGEWMPDAFLHAAPQNEGFDLKDWKKWGKKHQLEILDGELVERDKSGISY